VSVKRKIVYASLGIGLCMCLLWGAWSQATMHALPPAKATVLVSRIVTNAAGKSYLEVDGRPYFYNMVEDGGFNKHAKEFRSDMAAAAAAHYTTFAFWLSWADLEATHNTWNFSSLDTVIDLARQFDLRLDIIWGGTSFNQQMYASFTPGWVRNNRNYQLKNVEGQPIENGNAPVANYSSTALLALEDNALTHVMGHLRDYDTTHRVIFIQLENEANGANFTYQGAFAVYNYINELARTVHSSPYQIATRVNLVNANLIPIINTEPAIDAQGPDPYRASVEIIRRAITDRINNTKFHYIAENAGWDNSTSLMTTAFASGGFYGLYSVAYDSYWHNPGLYGTDYTSWTHATTTINNLNTAYNKIGSIIAASPAASMLDFNTETDIPSHHYHRAKDLGGRSIGMVCGEDDAPVGLAVEYNGSYYLVADNDAYFFSNGQPVVAEVGHLDAKGQWVKESDSAWTRNAANQYVIPYAAGQALKVSF